MHHLFMNEFDVMMKHMELRGVTKAEMARRLKVTDQRFGNWKRRGSIPKNMIEPAANILDINMSELLGIPKSDGQAICNFRTGVKIARLRKEENLTKIAAAHAALLDPDRYAEIERGRTQPTVEELQSIAIAFGIDGWDNVIEIMPTEKDFRDMRRAYDIEDAIYKIIEVVPNKTLINIYENIEVSAGDGNIIDGENPTDHLWVENKWLQEIVHFVPEKMAIIKVRGDSMEPTLSPGDMILIDRQPIERDQLNDGIYVINRGDTTHVKRLQCVESGIRIISDNKAYDAETVTNGMTICGRVIWAWRGKRF